MQTLSIDNVKIALGITGTYQDNTIQAYYDDVIDYLTGAGVAQEKITVGLVARGVADLWNYGSGDGKLSEYFYQRAAQLAIR